MGCVGSSSITVSVAIPSRSSQCRKLSLENTQKCLEYLASLQPAGTASAMAAAAAREAGASAGAAPGIIRRSSSTGSTAATPELSPPFAIIIAAHRRRSGGGNAGGGRSPKQAAGAKTVKVINVESETTRGLERVKMLLKAVSSAPSQVEAAMVREQALANDELRRVHALLLVHRDVLRAANLRLRGPLDIDAITVQLRRPLSMSKLRKLCRIFSQMDLLNAGEVSAHLIATWLEGRSVGREAMLTDSVFFPMLLDVNGAPAVQGKINAEEWCLMVTTVCEMNDEELLEFTFRHCAERRGSAHGGAVLGVDPTTLSERFPELSRARDSVAARGVQRGAAHPGNVALLKECDGLVARGIVDIDVEDWKTIYSRTRLPWMPVLIARDALRRATFGESWWRSRANAAAADPPGESFLLRPQRFGALSMGGRRGHSGYFHLHHLDRQPGEGDASDGKGKAKRSKKKDRRGSKEAWRLGKEMRVTRKADDDRAKGRGRSRSRSRNHGSDDSLDISARRLSKSTVHSRSGSVIDSGGESPARRESMFSSHGRPTLMARLSSGGAGEEAKESDEENAVIGSGLSPSNGGAGGPPRRAVPMPSRTAPRRSVDGAMVDMRDLISPRTRPASASPVRRHNTDLAVSPTGEQYQIRRTSTLAQLKHRFATSKKALEPPKRPQSAAELKFYAAEKKTLERRNSQRSLMGSMRNSVVAGVGPLAMPVRDYRVKPERSRSLGTERSADGVTSPARSDGSRPDPLLRSSATMKRSGQLDPLSNSDELSRKARRKLSRESSRSNPDDVPHQLKRTLSRESTRSGASARRSRRHRSPSLSSATSPDEVPGDRAHRSSRKHKSRPASAKKARSRPTSASRGRSPSRRTQKAVGGAGSRRGSKSLFTMASSTKKKVVPV